ncbi:hypothetical protein PtrSN002B_008692 [Pyrenophora tritici-repentis]|uniref:Uncharacterized protein n=1 Tax=Pyrenophora tritici-repentis TaxID=45151 RepID=A0A2W1DYP8_9PLEO|nr:hypothetical protein PtrV1_04154 [Pyrenophora tritici-repentis]KAF7451839.1 hypothetical protein A1F99_036160 [Pyrenophora tritici-repentis]KAF7575037.1 hypothetical protein PtrM4_066610 [Pyrenophora tritici-repentis]KAG9386197.1 hypothetical protein A1F94_002947 [Pyrenophora tritici-repentis]KAI0568893.1 hypothetical protein Alg130_11889 [Pyrenophora tritici-repentis]
MKLTLLCLLPAVSAFDWFTNNGWGRPDQVDLSDECIQQEKTGTHYYCATGATTLKKNPFPQVFPYGRNGCANANKQGVACNWGGQAGSIVCCP